MKKNLLTTILILSLLVMVLALSACSGSGETADTADAVATTEANTAEGTTEQEADTDAAAADSDQEEEEITMTMKINDETVNVKWENNDSVRALMKMAEESPVVVDMSMYGGFEQVGSLGTTLPSNDQNIKTNPGDIVLYTSDNIVVFYGNNSWAYTRLGHIENKSKAELQEMLSGNSVVITITAE
ncbi:MAG: hypothetical protein IKI38_01455 [Mogibacterium sp.]|nr:hypothetical protein [Mogibacterium sp.]